MRALNFLRLCSLLYSAHLLHRPLACNLILVAACTTLRCLFHVLSIINLENYIWLQSVSLYLLKKKFFWIPQINIKELVCYIKWHESCELGGITNSLWLKFWFSSFFLIHFQMVGILINQKPNRRNWYST